MALTVWNDKTVSGQYAGLVAASWKGQTYIRSAPSKVNNNSPKQQWHKRVYKYIYKIITPIYETWWKKYYNPPKMTPANLIVKSQVPQYWQESTFVRIDLINFPISQFYGNINYTCTVLDTTENLKIKINSIENPDNKLITKLCFICCIESPDSVFATVVDVNTEEFNIYLQGRYRGKGIRIYTAIATETEVSNYTQKVERPD